MALTVGWGWALCVAVAGTSRRGHAYALTFARAGYVTHAVRRSDGRRALALRDAHSILIHMAHTRARICTLNVTNTSRWWWALAIALATTFLISKRDALTSLRARDLALAVRWGYAHALLHTHAINNLGYRCAPFRACDITLAFQWWWTLAPGTTHAHSINICDALAPSGAQKTTLAVSRWGAVTATLAHTSSIHPRYTCASFSALDSTLAISWRRTLAVAVAYPIYICGANPLASGITSHRAGALRGAGWDTHPSFIVVLDRHFPDGKVAPVAHSTRTTPTQFTKGSCPD